VLFEKVYKSGSLQKETAFDANQYHNKYHGWRKFYEYGFLTREELFEHGDLMAQRSYFADGSLKSASATLGTDPTQKSLVEFDEAGNLTNIKCSAAVIGPKQKKWCGLDGSESTVSIFSGGIPSKKLTFIGGKLTNYVRYHDDALTVSATIRSHKDLHSRPQSGLQNDFYSDGKKKFEKRYNFVGQLDGIQRFYEHGFDKPVIEDLYEVGAWKESRIFYSTGQTKLHFVWNKISGRRRIGTYESFFESGKLESKGDCYNEVDKNWAVSFSAIPTFIKHGQTLSWDENGDLREKSSWRNGERNGITDYYYERAGVKRLIKSAYSKGVNSTEKEYVESSKGWRPVVEREFSASGAIKKAKKI
jgi:antitoxin component YwqK of YwqJK toxin-antitoxin module